MPGDAAAAGDVDIDLKVKKKGGGMMKIILIVVGAAVIMAVSVVTAVYVSKSMIQETIQGASSDGEAQGAEQGGGHGEKKAAGHGERKASKHGGSGEAIYTKLGDAFVVNFMAGDQIRYLQVTIEVMSRDADVPAAIEKHLPVIRNNLVMLFSGLDYKTLSSVEGKQKIREEALAEVQKILDEKTGYPGIDDLYFTSFVMQ